MPRAPIGNWGTLDIDSHLLNGEEGCRRLYRVLGGRAIRVARISAHKSRFIHEECRQTCRTLDRREIFFKSRGRGIV